MARKGYSPPADRVEDEGKRVLLWLERARSVLPPGGSLAVTVRRLPRQLVLVSFRVVVGEESLISEAREGSVEAAVDGAGSRILAWLGRYQPAPPAPLSIRFLRFLGVAA